MQAHEAAKIFHDWAFDEGLMPDGPRGPVTSTAADKAKITPVTVAGKQVLRTKLVQTVGFNETRSEILVYTRRTAPVSKKAMSFLPSAVENIAIKYRQGAQEPIGAAPSVPFGGPAYVVRAVGGVDRYTCGSSISTGNFRDAGTLGALVRNAQGELFGLSNNHVSGHCSFAEVGLPILAPGVFDVTARGQDPFTLGHHSQALRMIAGSADNVDHKLNLDAAIFRIADASRVSSYQRTDYDTPGSSAPLTAGLLVEKVGRTTGLTRGFVQAQVQGAHPISYSAQLHGFAGVVSFEPVFTIIGLGNVAFSDGGDSGSLITSVDPNGQRVAVGIVVGGMGDARAPGGKVTIALAIEPILHELAVTLATGHNV